jgi:hypothetical protein
VKKLLSTVLVLVFGVLFFAGCKKDGVVTLTATSQRYHGQGKAYVDSDNYACWTNGDGVKINSSNATITLTTETSSESVAKITGVPKSTDGYYAFYPDSLANSFTGSGFTITLPSIIGYNEVNGHQVLVAPMAAKADDDNLMVFSNLCFLLKVHINESNNFLKSLTVKTTDGTPLSGTSTVTFSGLTPSLGTVTGCDSVRLDFGNGRNLKVNGGQDFFIPLPPLPSGKILQLYAKDIYGRRIALTASGIPINVSIPANVIAPLPSGLTVPDDTRSGTMYKWITMIASGTGVTTANTGAYLELCPPTNTTKIEMTFSTKSPNNCRFLTGSASSSNYYYLGMSGTSSSPRYFSASFCDSTRQNTAWTRKTDSLYRQTIEVEHDATRGYRLRAVFENLSTGNINTIYTPYNSTGIPDNAPNIMLFAYRRGQYCLNIKLYSYKLWQADTLAYDLVPCENSSIKGLYDVVHRQFMTLTEVTTETSSIAIKLGNN